MGLGCAIKWVELLEWRTMSADSSWSHVAAVVSGNLRGWMEPNSGRIGLGNFRTVMGYLFAQSTNEEPTCRRRTNNICFIDSCRRQSSSSIAWCHTCHPYPSILTTYHIYPNVSPLDDVVGVFRDGPSLRPCDHLLIQEENNKWPAAVAAASSGWMMQKHSSSPQFTFRFLPLRSWRRWWWWWLRFGNLWAGQNWNN